MQLPEQQINMLGRYSTFPDFVKSYFHAQEMIRSGQAKAAPSLPTNATPEQIAEYRTKLGVPDTVDGYKVALDDGLVLSDEDNRILGEVFKTAHAMFVKPEVVSKLTNAMLRGRAAEFQNMIAQHGVDKQNCLRTLHTNWGADFETNANIARSMIGRLPETVRDAFAQAELFGGKKILNSPEVVVWLADIGRELNPLATVLPNSNNPTQALGDEIKKIEKMMVDTPDAYWKDAALQKRYQDLLSADAAHKAQQKKSA